MSKFKALVVLFGLVSSGAWAGNAQMRDSDLTVNGEQDYITTLNAFTASRTLTLPPPSAVNSRHLEIVDTAGAVSATNTLTIVAADGSTINGSASLVVRQAGAYVFITPGTTGYYAVLSVGTTGSSGGGGNGGAGGAGGGGAVTVPGGTDGQAQYNNNGAFAGFDFSTDFLWNGAHTLLSLDNFVNRNWGITGNAANCLTIQTNGKGLVLNQVQTPCTPDIANVTGLGAGVADVLYYEAGKANGLAQISSIIPTGGNCVQWGPTGLLTSANAPCGTGTGAVTPGGTNGQVQYNNNGALGGLTVSGDATLATTGALTLTTVNNTPGSYGDAVNCTTETVDAKGRITNLAQMPCTPSITRVTGLGSGVASAMQLSAGAANGFPLISPTLPAAGNCAQWQAGGVIGAASGACGAGSATPGGTNGQIQYNNNGAMGGFTAQGDATISAANGAVTVTGIRNIPVDPFGSASGDVLYYSGTSYVHRALISAINTVCVLGPSNCANLFGYFDPLWFGAQCSGTTDDTTALAATFAAAAAAFTSGAAPSVVRIPDGTCLTSARIVVGQGTIVRGIHRNVSGVRMTGADYIFDLTTPNNVSISDLNLSSTRAYTSWATPNVGAILITANAIFTNLELRNLNLSSFNSNYWIRAVSGTIPVNNVVSNIILNNINITSAPADIPTSTTATQNFNTAIQFAVGTNTWQNVWITNNRITGSNLCNGIVTSGPMFRYRIMDNTILDIGSNNQGNHCDATVTGVNGINIITPSSNAVQATDGIISRNYISNPIQSGIYIQGSAGGASLASNAVNTEITNNMIVGHVQGLTGIGGGIVVAYATNVRIGGNVLRDNRTALNIAQQAIGEITIQDNYCTTSISPSVCVLSVSSTGTTGNVDRRIIRGNYFSAMASGTPMTFNSTTQGAFGFIDISGNTLYGSVSSQTPFFNSVSVSMATVAGNTMVGFTGIGANSSATLIANNAGVSMLQANLAILNAVNGSTMYVTDGVVGTSPCQAATTGGGSNAVRQGGVWRCL